MLGFLTPDKGISALKMERIKSAIPLPLKSIAKRALLEVRFRRRIHATATLAESLQCSPISTIRISPARIDRMMLPDEELYREYTPGSVVVGDWDKQTKPFIDSIYYRSLRQRFADGDPWAETTLYQSAVDRVPGGLYHDYNTVEDVQEFGYILI